MSTVLHIPNPGAERSELARFAYSFGSKVYGADETVIREFAATLQMHVGDHDEDPYAAGVLDALRLVARSFGDLVAARRHAEAQDAGDGSARHRILRILADSGRPLRPKDVAESLGLSRPYVSRTLAALVDHGFITKEESVNRLDGRSVSYRLTPSGEDEMFAGQQAVRNGASSEKMQAARLTAARAMLESVKTQRRSGSASTEDFDVLERAAAVAAEQGADRLLIDILGERSTLLRQGGDLDAATEVVETLLSQVAYTEEFQQYASARSEYERGKVVMARSRGEDGAALNHFENVDRLLETGVTDPALRVWNDIARSECFRVTGQGLSAMDAAERAFAMAREVEERYGVVRAGLQLGLAHRVSGQAQECIEVLTGVHELAVENRFENLAAQCLFHQGEALRYAGRSADALPVLHKAVAALRDADTRGSAFALSSLGACMFDADDLEGALGVLNESLRVSQRAGAFDAEALTRRRIASVQISLGAAEDGERNLQDALDMYSGKTVTSSIGRIECQAEMVSGSRHLVSPERTLREACESLRLFRVSNESSDWAAPSTRDRSRRRVRLVDRWVFSNLRQAALKLDLPDVAKDVAREWDLMSSAGIAGVKNAPVGKSLMGKEPPLFLATNTH